MGLYYTVTVKLWITLIKYQDFYVTLLLLIQNNGFDPFIFILNIKYLGSVMCGVFSYGKYLALRMKAKLLAFIMSGLSAFDLYLSSKICQQVPILNGL